MKNDPHDLKNTWLNAQGEPAQETLICDPKKYREDADNSDLSEEEQDELLLTLWSIMAAFVDMGFGLDSVQLISIDETQADTDTAIDDPKAALPPGSQALKDIDHDE